MRYSSKRTYTWSPTIAYSVGLMTSDGSLSSDGRHLDLTSSEIDQLHNFNLAIGKKHKITKKFSGDKKSSYRIQFSDVAYYDFLIKAGLTPRKSLSIKTVGVPDELYGHFLRGLFDGDGTTYGYHDPRWPSSFLFYTGFSGASKPFLENLQMRNRKLIGLCGGSIRNNTRCFSLVYAKADSYRLYDYLYSDAEIIYLKRKYSRLCSFIKYDKDATIRRQQARVVKLVNTLP